MRMLNQHVIQKRYEGFLNTPQLWESELCGIQPFILETNHFSVDSTFNEHLRLGKYVEQLFSFQIKKLSTTAILAENIQIQKDKITLGELDFLILKEDIPVHVELVYKFYLYDNRVGNSEIDHFIGPNRKDSLKLKLTKLRDKQLPLLFKDECADYIHALGLAANDFMQQTCFKGQIFLSFHEKNIRFDKINKAAVTGRYLPFSEIHLLKESKFYIPIKKDWLINPHEFVNWINFENAKEKLADFIHRSYAPLCWVKSPKGQIQKVFVTWWT